MKRILAYKKWLALLLCLVLLSTAALGTTLAYVVTGTPSIINTFLSGIAPDGSLTISKTVSHPFGTGYVLPDNEHTAFAFTVDLGPENAGKTFGSFKADAEGRLTVTVKAGASITIPDLSVGTTATVTEQQPGAGFTAPESQTVTIARGENTLSVVNPYTPAPVPDAITVKGQKTLAGRDWQDGDRFTFALEVQKDGGWTELGRETLAYDPADEAFDTFDFTQILKNYSLDTAGTHSFRVTEVEGSIGGITYDKAESRFDLLVGDADMDGALEIQSIDSPSANTTVDRQEKSLFIRFRNEYAPAGSDDITIDIIKNLTDHSGQNKSPAGFSFELRNEAGELLKTSDPTGSDGTTQLRLVYSAADAGRFFHYTLKEVNQGKSGYIYDDTVYHLRVDVSDNGDGSASALIREFDPETLRQPETTDNTEETDTETGNTEEAAAETESAAPAREPSGAESFTASFTNAYSPSAATLPISGTKKLTGRSLNAEEFTFFLYETEAGFAIAEGAQPLRTARNDAAGSFSFENLSFSRPGQYYYVVTEDASPALGGILYDTTRYQICVLVEDIGGALSVQKVTVTDAAGKSSDILFQNSYQPKSAILTLSGQKTLNGRAMKAGEFTFHLYEASFLTGYGFNKGELYARTTNGTEGSFAFRIEYAKPGTFHYIVTESAGSETGMTYDNTRYGVEVVVRDDLTGQLKATVTRIVKIGTESTDVSAITFCNTYTAPIDPTKPTTDPDKPDETTSATESTAETQPSGTKLPQTGQLWWPVPVLLVMGILFLLLDVLRRRGTRYE